MNPDYYPPRPAGLARLIKAVRLYRARQALVRAISTAGGVRFAGLTTEMMFASKPGVFAAGEMLDWEGTHRRLPASGVLRDRFCRSAWRSGLVEHPGQGFKRAAAYKSIPSKTKFG